MREKPKAERQQVPHAEASFSLTAPVLQGDGTDLMLQHFALRIHI